MLKRVLLDENLSPRLRYVLGDDLVCESVVYRGWQGRSNGDLLRLAVDEFDALLTLDRNLTYQQPIHDYAIAVVVIRVEKDVTLADLVAEAPRLRATLLRAKPGRRVEVDLRFSP